jgi:hypothetical protein
MKNLFNIIVAIVILTQSISCQESGGPQEPPVWFHYFVLLDEEGRDFFETNPSYHIENFRICLTQNENNCYKLEEEPAFVELIKQNGENVIGMTPGSLSIEGRMKTERYFDFGNGDIDTLTFNWAPQSEKPQDRYDNLDYFQFFLNGGLIHEYNFIEKDPAWYMLVSNNGSIEKDEIFKIYITKKPQPEEFHPE